MAAPGTGAGLLGLLGLLTGGDGLPAQGPLAWAAAAVSRRDAGSAAVTTTAAVTTSTGQPYVRSVSLPPPCTYGTGRTMKFTLNFNEPVKVLDPSVFIPIQIGFAMVNAQYVSGNGTNRLTFSMDVPANVSGALNIGRVSNQLLPGASAPVRIFDFNGVGHEQPADQVTNPKIVDLDGNPALDTIPTIDTSRITVDATGPGVVGYGSTTANDGVISTWSGPFGLLHLAWTQVQFDQAVFVKGSPSIPVSIGGNADALNLIFGAWTPTLTFAKVSFGADPGPVDFYSNGQVIDLPIDSNITDRLGNSVPVVLDDFGQNPGTLGPALIENGNRLVVLGAHYQYLGSATAAQLNDVLTTEAAAFYYGPGGSNLINPYTGQSPASYWAAYQPPTFATPRYGVDLYRVAYASTVPEQNNRPTLAYGLVAIPTGTSGPLPVVSYQHGTVIGKGEVPSQSFNLMLGRSGTDLVQNYFAYETRLNVAQFAGQGYAVIAADYFGVGNSLENDAYFSKPSAQQATLDMYKASVGLLASKGQPATKLFLDGWSQGGLVTVQFQEKLQSEGIPVAGVGTAAGPDNLQLATNSTMFNPRTWPASAPNTPGAVWANVPTAFNNFSVPGYVGDTNSPLDLLGVNYEVSRALYMREYNSLEFTAPNAANYNDPTAGVIVRRDGLADALLPYSFNLIFAPQYSGSANQPVYAQTNYAQLLAKYGAGQNYLTSPMQTYYGLQDEAITVDVGAWLYNWQTQNFGKSNIAAFPITAGNHRATYLSAVAGELGWFNSLL